jgi:hypothetical protein
MLISQQLKPGCRIDNRRLEIIGVRKSNCNADTIPFWKPVRDRMQAED